MKKICVITGSRADYGLLKGVMNLIKKSVNLDLKIIATGAHCEKKFGYTYKEIVSDNFSIDKKIVWNFDKDSSKNISESASFAMKKYSDYFLELKPDLILLLGDRYEIFIAAVVATFYRIPLAHIHGGEVTEGSYDESMRHSITKMAHLHFVANEEYRKRVIQLGEHPKSVFNVGGLGIDAISKLKCLSREDLEKEINFKFLKKNYIITYNPVTLEPNSAKKQINELLKAIGELKNTGLIFTMPNADNENSLVSKAIQDFCKTRKYAKFYTSLGQLRYISAIKQSDGVIGNSSSGLLEVPFLMKGTINIGIRQKGRSRSLSIIDCDPNKASIQLAIQKLHSRSFLMQIKNQKSIFGKPGASKNIIKIIHKEINSIKLVKSFYNLNFDYSE